MPPRSKALLSSPEMLVERLKPLIGTTFALTGKSRTDGSKFRKLVPRVFCRNMLPCLRTSVPTK